MYVIITNGIIHLINFRPYVFSVDYNKVRKNGSTKILRTLHSQLVQWINNLQQDNPEAACIDKFSYIQALQVVRQKPHELL